MDMSSATRKSIACQSKATQEPQSTALPASPADEQLHDLDQVLGQIRSGWPPEFALIVKRKDIRERLNQRKPQISTNSPPTLDVINKFLNSKLSSNLREATIQSYRDSLMPFGRAYPTLPSGPEQIEAYLAPHRGENSTAWNIYTRLRLVYGFAEKRGLLPFPNPMHLVERPTKKQKSPKPLTISQARALLDAIEDDRERGLVFCLFGLGLRLKETRHLRVEDIGEDTIWIMYGKERDEPMPLIPEVGEALLKLAEGKAPNDYLFPGANGQPLSDSMVQLIIKRLFVRAGIKGVRASPHTLRHSRGAITAAAGLDTISSGRLLRQKDIKQTQRYSQLDLNQLRTKEERFNPLRLLGKKPDYAQCQPDIGIAPPAEEPHTDAEQHTSNDTEVETGYS